MKHHEFTTFYFEPGFESLINLAQYLETMTSIDTAVGSDFINFYSEESSQVDFALEVIHAYCEEYPHTKLAEIQAVANENPT